LVFGEVPGLKLLGLVFGEVPGLKLLGLVFGEVPGFKLLGLVFGEVPGLKLLGLVFGEVPGLKLLGLVFGEVPGLVLLGLVFGEVPGFRLLGLVFGEVPGFRLLGLVFGEVPGFRLLGLVFGEFPGFRLLGLLGLLGFAVPAGVVIGVPIASLVTLLGFGAAAGLFALGLFPGALAGLPAVGAAFRGAALVPHKLTKSKVLPLGVSMKQTGTFTRGLEALGKSPASTIGRLKAASAISGIKAADRATVICNNLISVSSNFAFYCSSIADKLQSVLSLKADIFDRCFLRG